MGSYRRLGNVEQHSGDGTSISDQLGHLWRSPRGTVLRIEALALVAITLSFFLAAFGSCRRWSNSWIVQKGFLAAQVLSLSLGTYSIGLMQSSPVKSEMYPIWAVSLLTLFGCVDPITTYNGLDYMGPFSNMVYQLCLYCGYVLLTSASTISGVAGNLAIGVLAAITFMRGFHRSLALVLPTRKREHLERLVPRPRAEPGALLPSDAAGHGTGEELEVPPPSLSHHYTYGGKDKVTVDDIRSSCKQLMGVDDDDDMTVIIEDACLGYSLSHLLQRRFLGLDTPSREMAEKRERFESFLARRGDDGAAAAIVEYKRALKAIEVELAFLYEAFFTSNEFLHHYEAKSSNLWVMASFIGICFVGAATAIPRTVTSRYPAASNNATCSASTSEGVRAAVTVGTTTADLVITLVILASLALLQLLQLMRCWTSNWARVSVAYEYAACMKKQIVRRGRAWWMRRKVFVVVTRTNNWFDKYLWQDKLGQYSVVVAGGGSGGSWERRLCSLLGLADPGGGGRRRLRCQGLTRMLGMEYVAHLLVGSSTSCGGGTEAAVRLHDDVKTRIAEFLGQIKSTKIGVGWSSLFAENGLGDCLEYLPCYSSSHGGGGDTTPDAKVFTHRVLAWHIATCYCQLADEPQEEEDEPQEEEEEATAASAGAGGEDRRRRRDKKNRRVAIALSKYCTYLLVSAPELLPGPSAETKRALLFQGQAGDYCRPGPIRVERNKLTEATNQAAESSDDDRVPLPTSSEAFRLGVCWGKRLLSATTPPRSGHWEVLALLWVQTLLYAAPYGDAQRHMQHLSRGGEFITHLWALLYHLGIDKWETELSAAGDHQAPGT